MSNLSRLNDITVKPVKGWLDCPEQNDDPLLDIAIGIGLFIVAFFGLWIVYCFLLVISAIINEGNGIELMVSKIIDFFRVP